jgi:two-component system, OmpR family, KDP operon response regulator KdpE
MRTDPNVMVCDTDAWTLHALQVTLGCAGFQVHATRTAAEALDYAALRRPDIAITETVLPDCGGVELCRRLRKWRTAAVLILSSVTAEQEKVRALDAGADDFLTKPFRSGELIARLHAILRRTKAGDRQSQLQLNGLRFDPYARVVYRNDVEVRLTPTEFELLQALARNRGRALTLTELAQQARGTAHQPCHATLCAHISHLRRKLASAAEFPPIYTDPGIGYRLQGPNCERKPDSSEPPGRNSSGPRPRSPKRNPPAVDQQTAEIPEYPNAGHDYDTNC